MAFEAFRLKAQSGARGVASSTGSNLQARPSGRKDATWPGSALDRRSDEWGTQPASAIAKTTDSRRGMRRLILDSSPMVGRALPLSARRGAASPCHAKFEELAICGRRQWAASCACGRITGASLAGAMALEPPAKPLDDEGKV
jgi:hypothetical protein